MTVYPVKKPRKKVKGSPVRVVARKARVRRSNPARKAREFARAYGSEERVEFVKARPCAACGIAGYSQNAHVPSKSGMSRKGDAKTIVPLCGARLGVIGCHGLLDTGNRKYLEAYYGADLDALAAFTENLWQSHIAERTA